MFKSGINYQTDIIINGASYFYSPAHQLIKHIVKTSQSQCQFSGVPDYLGGKLFAQKILMAQTWFSSVKVADKELIAEFYYDINIDRITCQISKSIEQKTDFIKIPLLIFKNIRENDLFKIETIERDVRHKAYIHYLATKAAILGSQIEIESGELMEFVSIPKAAFKRVVGSLVKKNKGKKDGKSKK